MGHFETVKWQLPVKAVVCKCSAKFVFLKNSYKSQGKNCARASSLINFQAKDQQGY